MATSRMFKKGKKKTFIFYGLLSKLSLMLPNKTMSHGKVLCEDSLLFFPMRKKFVLINPLTGCLNSIKEMGAAVTKHSQGSWPDSAGAARTALKGMNHLFLLGLFDAASHHFVTFAAAAPLAFWSCLIGVHLPRVDAHPSSSSPPPSAAGCQHRAFAFPTAGETCPLRQQVANAMNQLQNGYFQPRLFPHIQKLLPSFLKQYFGCLLWHTLQMVCHGVWALSWITVRVVPEIRLKSQHLSLP